MVSPSPQMQFDALTGALSRAAGEAFLRAALQGALLPVAVLFLDVDHFKSINDAFGHAAGDEALKFVAQTLQNVVGERGQVVRLGGDEFLVLLPQTEREDAQALAEEILATFRSKVVSRSYPLHLRLSIGVAVAPEDTQDADELLKIADNRHYFAKNSGGHRVVATDRFPVEDLIAVPRRPVGQREQLAQLYHDMNKMLGHESGIIHIHSMQYGGAGTFIAQAQAIASLQNYIVLTAEATPALHLRYLGVFARALEAALPAEDYCAPETAEDVWNLLDKLTASVPSYEGIMFLLTNAEWLDKASAELIQRLLSNPGQYKRFAFVYSSTTKPRVSFRAPFLAHLTLPPLDFHEVEAWLRHALRWEAPRECVQWVWEYTEGLPELISPTLEALAREGFLQPAPNGQWQWYPPQNWDAYGVQLQPPTPPRVGVSYDLPPLIGRNRDLYALRRAIEQHALVTVMGASGVGKTRLLQQLVLESDGEFTDGVYFLSLERTVFPQLPLLLAQTFHLTPHPDKDPLEQIIAYLKRHHVMLVLDGLTEVADATSVLGALLNAAPQNRIVVSSPRRLHHPLEHPFTLGGLDTRSRKHALSPAAEMFIYGATRSGVALPDDPLTLRTVEDICQWVGGLPMAINIVSAWSTTFTPQGILRRLQSGEEGVRSLESVLDKFWELLAPHEQQQIAQLSLFRGTFCYEGARYVAGASPFFLDALASKAYIRRDEEGRFYAHPLLQQFSRNHFENFREIEQESRLRHAEWYLQQLPRKQGGDTEALRWSFVLDETYLLDTLAAWRWALENQKIPLLMSAVPWLIFSLGDLNRFVEARALIVESIEALKQYPVSRRDASYFALRAFLEISRAEFYFHLGDYDNALRVLQQVRRRMLPFLPLIYQAYLLYVHGRVLTARGAYVEARQSLVQACGIYEHLGVSHFLFSTHNALGVLAYNMKDYDEAEREFRKALAVASQKHRVAAVAALLNNLGNLAWEQGDYAKAEQMLEEAFAELPDPNRAPSLTSSIMDSIGRVKWALNKPAEALTFLDDAVRYAHRSGVFPNMLIAMVTISRVWLQIGRYDEAASLLHALLASAEMPHYYREEAQQILAQIQQPVSVEKWEADNMDALARRVRRLNHRFIAMLMQSVQV